MRHMKSISRIPVRAQESQGLCTDINDNLQARFCFVLAFFTDVFLPLLLPFVNIKAGDNAEEAAE
jgi:hypothetical protein